ncbi:MULTISPECIES: M23 family metallopeptidase [sulfur-oxidizing symbionts]|jgi:murein DD-endopeptidase MepM/ murein hydrolase activator NlpD|uniref:Peptidase M23 n=3 Tax=Gammaproteobacteria TaxID=1236 RepID=G2FGP6_9GAMM|nr:MULTISPECIES: M23 family metallopeptidase [sulfur-oxidizing symbionts]EGV51501.1 peptidase M23 [endosymbiont of Riftia pachyptila (vent Ph05)]EGW54010.1 peptidase M23 [endosymbiont of Tevnia jerichonana (vent Tica)]USF86556.1 M23 family metallopeptidase [Candidatus Endoriftia persephone]
MAVWVAIFPLRSVVLVWLMVLALLPGSVAALSLQGDLLQGGLAIAQVEPGTQVRVDGKPVRVSEEGIFIIGFSRENPLQSEIRLIAPDGSEHKELISIGKRSYKIQRIDGLPQSKVTPPKRDWERIRKETAQIKAARKLDEPRTDFLKGFILPVKGRISGVYGSQRILNGKPKRPHSGLDLAASEGAPVVAPADGVITLAHPDMFYSGGTLLLDHGHGLTTSYLHLSRLLVEQGQRVRQGEVIGEVGMTGRATGPHLHWGLNLFEKRLDPQLLLKADPTSKGE